jgi:hypothetical protein
MPNDKYYNGVDWEVMDSQNSDTVDGIDLRVNGEILEISDDGGSTWSPVSMSAEDVLAALITVDGTGSGLDSDTTDGLHFRINSDILEISTDGSTWSAVSMTANDILTALKTVDGSGSGLDADNVVGVNFYTGTTAPSATSRINVDGYLYATKVYNAVFNDLAEFMDKCEEDLSPGDILIWDDEKKGLRKTDVENDTRVIGVYSDSYGFALGGSEKEKNKVPIGISGRVWVKVKTEVNNGDGLITSKHKGYAKPGIGGQMSNITCRLKAMESFSPTEEEKEKRIMCLIL